MICCLFKCGLAPNLGEMYITLCESFFVQTAVNWRVNKKKLVVQKC